jgi:hypothetical protein
VEYRTGEEELYDLERDQFELRSRHRDPDYADVEQQPVDELEVLRDCAGASCR